MLSQLASALNVQNGGAKGGNMVSLFFIMLISLLIKALLVQLSWNMVMPRILNNKSGLRDTITFSEALMLVILVSNLL